MAIRYFSPVVRKPPSQRNFVMNTTRYIYTLKRTIFKQKKIQNMITISKWRPNYLFLLRVISISAKNWKTTFSIDFFFENYICCLFAICYRDTQVDTKVTIYMIFCQFHIYLKNYTKHSLIETPWSIWQCNSICVAERIG